MAADRSASPVSSPSPFLSRHIGPREDEIQRMLGTLGYRTLEELTRAVVPPNIYDASDTDIPAGIGEEEALAELRLLANKNQVRRSLIGQGYYGTHTPKVLQRNVLENPAWYTAYTPYQPEISQGRLEILFYFQTLVSELTGLEIANASMLDEGTAAAEAMTLCHRSSKNNSHRFLVSKYCHPQTIEVIQTRAKPLGIEVVEFDERQPVTDWSDVFGVIVQYPATDGSIHNYQKLIADAHANQALVIWDQYQQQHDVDSLIGQTAGIDPVTERIWFGSSAKDIWQQMATQGVDVPLYFIRVGSQHYVRKGGHR